MINLVGLNINTFGKLKGIESLEIGSCTKKCRFGFVEPSPTKLLSISTFSCIARTMTKLRALYIGGLTFNFSAELPEALLFPALEEVQTSCYLSEPS